MGTSFMDVPQAVIPGRTRHRSTDTHSSHMLIGGNYESKKGTGTEGGPLPSCCFLHDIHIVRQKGGFGKRDKLKVTKGVQND